ncbi:hypothetical protein D3C78_641360 [compost metagenome]
MSDDIDNMTLIRDRAKAGVGHASRKEWSKDFYHGLSIGDALQARVDALVRDYKPEMLALIKGDHSLLLDEAGVDIIEDPEQKAYLVIFACCGMGFFISERIHKPRELRAKRTTLAEVKHQVLQTPVAKPAVKKTNQHQQPPVTRSKRKFVTIRHVTA